MTIHKTGDGAFKQLSGLKAVLDKMKKKPASPASTPPSKKKKKQKKPPVTVRQEEPEGLPEIKEGILEVEEGRALFAEAMRDVKPIARGPIGRVEAKAPAPPPRKFDTGEYADADPEFELQRVVNRQSPINLPDTDEYLEYTGKGVDMDVPHQLHMGRFAVQDMIDLHGMIEQDASDAFDEFMRRAIHKRLLCVKVIHGRGLRSPGQPVLKTAMVGWLRSRYNKRVRAFATARANDGGLGATYILLR